MCVGGVQVTKHVQKAAAANAEGQTMPTESVALCMEGVRQCLKAMTPISSLDHVRPTLEEAAGVQMTHSSHLAQFIPTILEHEVASLKLDPALHFVDAAAIVTDGTTCVHEHVCTVSRTTSKTLHVKQTLTSVKAAAHHVAGKQNATLCMLSNKRQGLSQSATICLGADRASSNNVMTDEVETVVQHDGGIGVFQSPCFAHTGSLAGKQFDTPAADKLVAAVAEMTGKSNVAKDQWRAQDADNAKPVAPSGVRWWNYWVSLTAQSNRPFACVFVIVNVSNRPFAHAFVIESACRMRVCDVPALCCARFEPAKFAGWG